MVLGKSKFKNKIKDLAKCLIVESRPHIQAHLVFADTQSQNEKPKELEFLPTLEINSVILNRKNKRLKRQ
ncbi:MAG: hypothetical protein A2033_12955 [Bacteroidetes bacterium GWA2_31_9]|nr:MAG: hypothetical protein A2033_12955 [Bacteroidetes bacterium GWA2_31_9]